jgi:hypothetical protein
MLLCLEPGGEQRVHAAEKLSRELRVDAVAHAGRLQGLSGHLRLFCLGGLFLFRNRVGVFGSVFFVCASLEALGGCFALGSGSLAPPEHAGVGAGEGDSNMSIATHRTQRTPLPLTHLPLLWQQLCDELWLSNARPPC